MPKLSHYSTNLPIAMYYGTQLCVLTVYTCIYYVYIMYIHMYISIAYDIKGALVFVKYL